MKKVKIIWVGTAFLCGIAIGIFACPKQKCNEIWWQDVAKIEMDLVTLWQRYYDKCEKDVAYDRQQHNLVSQWYSDRIAECNARLRYYEQR
jgi:hypothetical protein